MSDLTRKGKEKVIDQFCNHRTCTGCPVDEFECCNGSTWSDETVNEAYKAVIDYLKISPVVVDKVCEEEVEVNMFDEDKVKIKFKADEMDETAEKAMKDLMEEGYPASKEEIKAALSKTQEAKADAGKAEIRLVPMEIVWAIAWIRMYGNEKYGDPDNWKTVEPERYRDALMRHLLHYISDPKSVDEESGYPYLWHAACNMAFLIHMDYGDMCCYDFAVKATKWEKIGKAVENNRISPSKELHELGESLRKEIDKAIDGQCCWTPCSLKLPDKEGEYLVTNDAGGMKNVEIDTFAHYEDDGKPFWMTSQNPIAWMPIPDVYKEKEDEV